MDYGKTKNNAFNVLKIEYIRKKAGVTFFAVNIVFIYHFIWPKDTDNHGNKTTKSI